jgi:hypothetical protein
MANSWAAHLDINGTLGRRLPTVTDPGTLGCDLAYLGTDCGYNVDTAIREMTQMLSITMGNKSYCATSANCPQLADGLSNTGSFNNLHDGGYCSSPESLVTPSKAWGDSFNDGKQDVGNKTILGYSWAVHYPKNDASTGPFSYALHFRFCGI